MVNAILIGLFVLAEYSIGSELNSYPDALRIIRWSPVVIQDSHMYSFVDGKLVGIGAHNLMLNFPFWLFFISTAANLILFVKLVRDYERSGS